MMKYEELMKECNPSMNHSELNDFLTLVENFKPRVLLEIGVHRGGSMMVWTRFFRPELSIGIDTQILPEAKLTPANYLIEGMSQDPLIYERIKEILGDRKIDFLVIDGSHYYDDVKKDFEMYSKLVNAGGVVMFHDVVLEGNSTVELYKYWPELQKEYRTQTISYPEIPGATGMGVLFL